MKGISDMVWFVITLILMGIVGIFITQAFSGFLGEAISNSAKLTAQQVEAIVNDLQSSPSGTVHEYRLPKVKGQLAFRGYTLGVKISANVDRFYNDTHFIEHLTIIPTVIDFTPQEGTIYFIRQGNNIIVSKVNKPGTCFTWPKDVCKTLPSCFWDDATNSCGDCTLYTIPDACPYMDFYACGLCTTKCYWSYPEKTGLNCAECSSGTACSDIKTEEECGKKCGLLCQWSVDRCITIVSSPIV